MLKGMAKELE